MSISSTNNIKLGLRFIKDNFFGIWSMTLKVILSALPLLIPLGVLMVTMLVPEKTLAANLSALSAGDITIAITVSLLLLAFPLLALSAMVVAIVRSIVFNEKLNTAIFSKLFDKKTVRVLAAILLIDLVILASVVIIIGIALLLSVGSLFIPLSMNPMALMMPLFFTILVLIPVVTYLIVRFSLIPIGVAVGDIQSISEALPKTNGHLWNVFKVLVLATLISIGLQLIMEIPTLLLSEGNEIVTLIGITIMVVFLIIIVPIAQIGTTALSHLYKKIR